MGAEELSDGFVSNSSMTGCGIRTRPWRRRKSKGPAPNFHDMVLRSESKNKKEYEADIDSSTEESSKPAQRRRPRRRTSSKKSGLGNTNVDGEDVGNIGNEEGMDGSASHDVEHPHENGPNRTAKDPAYTPPTRIRYGLLNGVTPILARKSRRLSGLEPLTNSGSGSEHSNSISEEESMFLGSEEV